MNRTQLAYSSPETDIIIIGAEDSFLSVQPGGGEGFEDPIED